MKTIDPTWKRINIKRDIAELENKALHTGEVDTSKLEKLKLENIKLDDEISSVKEKVMDFSMFDAIFLKGEKE